MGHLDLTEVFGLIFGAGGVGAVVVKSTFNYLSNSRSEQERRSHIEGLQKITRIYDELNQIISSNTSIQRVMVIRSSNGGKIPKPGCRIFLRVLHETYRTLWDSVIHSNLWEERQADQHCIEVAREVAMSGKDTLIASELPEESTLKAIYDASGTTGARLFLLKLSGEEMIYLSVNYTDMGQEDSMAKAVLISSVAGLKQIFK